MRKLTLLSALLGASLCHAGMIGSTVTGELFFASPGTNFYDPANGRVPSTGYQNSSSNQDSATIMILGGSNDFGQVGLINQDVTSFTDTGFTFTDTVLNGVFGINGSIELQLTDPAFTSLVLLSNDFSGLTFGLVGDVITVDIPFQFITTGEVLSASFSTVPEPSTLSFLAIGALGLAGWRKFRARA